MPIIFQSLYSCTDSKSLCEALILSNPHTSSIHNSFNSISSSIFIQWIPGHSVIPGNELANKTAKKSTTIASNTILPVSFSSSVQVKWSNSRRSTYTQTLFANLSTPRGFTWLEPNQKLKSWRTACSFTIWPPSFSPSVSSPPQTISRSNLPEMPPRWQDLNHCLCECPAGHAIRQQVFANHKGSLEWLATRSRDVVAYARKTLVNLDP